MHLIHWLFLKGEPIPGEGMYLIMWLLLRDGSEASPKMLQKLTHEPMRLIYRIFMKTAVRLPQSAPRLVHRNNVDDSLAMLNGQQRRRPRFAPD